MAFLVKTLYYKVNAFHESEAFSTFFSNGNPSHVRPPMFELPMASCSYELGYEPVKSTAALVMSFLLVVGSTMKGIYKDRDVR